MRPRVLVIDDSLTERTRLAAALENAGFVAVLASSGAEGRQALAKDEYALIVLDVELPDDDGVLILETLRESGPSGRTPVILLCAEDEVKSGLRGIVSQAEGYVPKPYDTADLIARVRAALTPPGDPPPAEAPRRVGEAGPSSRRTLRALEDELARRERELDMLTHSIAHDLRAPLNTLDGFSEALLEDYGAKLDDTARSYIERMRRATRRMSALLDDLSDLSRVGRSALEIAPLDLALLFRRSYEESHLREPERTVKLIAPEQLILHGDRRLLGVLVGHLVDNALKFTTKRSDAAIELGARSRDGTTTYFVRDNGVGFEMSKAAKLFAPFQRLHSESEFPGRGIGLATVHRIVDRHGGRVWAESSAGLGATISFTLGTPGSAARVAGEYRSGNDEKEQRDDA